MGDYGEAFKGDAGPIGSGSKLTMEFVDHFYLLAACRDVEEALFSRFQPKTWLRRIIDLTLATEDRS